MTTPDDTVQKFFIGDLVYRAGEIATIDGNVQSMIIEGRVYNVLPCRVMDTTIHLDPEGPHWVYMAEFRGSRGYTQTYARDFFLTEAEAQHHLYYKAKAHLEKLLTQVLGVQELVGRASRGEVAVKRIGQG